MRNPDDVTTSPEGGPEPDDAQERDRLRRLHDVAPSRVLHALTSLGVADAMGDGQVTSGELADRIGVSPDTARRLLRAGHALGVVDRFAADGFRLSTAGRLLRRDHRLSLAAEFADNDLYVGWERFTESLRVGQISYELSHGERVFDRLRRDEESRRLFHDHMRRRSAALYEPYVPLLGDLAGEHLVDVGSGTAGLSVALLERSATLTVTAFDLPEVVDLIAEGESRRFGERLRVCGGSFAEGVPEGGTSYLLAGILHDWPDRQASEVLAACLRAGAPDAPVLILDRIMDDEAPGAAGMADMWMLAMTGGRERNVTEWKVLAGQAGLRLQRVVTAASEVSLLVMARR